jgi:hypothetical protein
MNSECINTGHLKRKYKLNFKKGEAHTMAHSQINFPSDFMNGLSESSTQLPACLEKHRALAIHAISEAVKDPLYKHTFYTTKAALSR